MPKFLIERQVPGVGQLSASELQAVCRKSVGVLRQLGPDIQWMESYVVDDKLYCLYLAPDQEMVREHARLAGVPCNSISEIKRIIDPATAE
ncbi:MAG: DUF4242 domain-containing protein [Thermomonas sp.]